MTDPDPKWEEVSLVVDSELSEAVAEVFARFAPNGVVIETPLRGWTANGEGIAELQARVYAYLPIDSKLDDSKQRLQEALWHLGFIRPLPEAEYRLIPDQNWAEAWKVHYQPIAIGEKLMIVPAWMETTDTQRLAIKIEPGMAFGTGTHPTTQLCLAMMETWFSKRNPDLDEVNVLDIGCGSGILSIAAIKLGASFVLGVDVDGQAIKVAQENAATNEIANGLEFAVGSVAEINVGRYSIQQAQLALANILAPVIIDLLEQGMTNLLAPGGSMILSGILEDQAAEVLTCLAQHKLKVMEEHHMMDWVAYRVTQ